MIAPLAVPLLGNPDKPSLNLGLLGPTLPGINALTRASADATYFDRVGVIQKASVALATNLQVRSEAFDNAAWGKTNCTVDADAAVAPPFIGGTVADRINVSAGAGNHHVIDAATITGGSIYTASAYFKDDGVGFAWVSIWSAEDSNIGAVGNLSTGEITLTFEGSVNGTITASGMDDVGNGWYRLWVSGSPHPSDTSVANVLGVCDSGNPSLTTLGVPTYTGVGGDDAFVFGSQLELGSSPTAYIATVAAAVSNYAARFDHRYDGATWVPQGLLTEVARTNNAPNSQEFDNANWSESNASWDENAAAAPDGTTTAGRLNIDFDVDEIHDGFSSVGSKVNSVVYCCSVFVKDDGAGFAAVTMFGGGSQVITAVFDLSTGAPGDTFAGATESTITDSGIIDVGGGWYRIWVSGIIETTSARQHWIVISASNSATPAYSLGRPKYVGVAGEDVFFWGAQFETGAFPTSYIATSGSAVARAADIATAGIGAIDPLRITGRIDARTAHGGGSQVLWQLDDGDENERIRVERDTSDRIRFIVTNGGVDQCDLDAGAVADDTDFTLRFRAEDNDFGASLDGAAEVVDTGGTIPTVTTQRLGKDSAGSAWNSTIARVALWRGNLNLFTHPLVGG